MAKKERIYVGSFLTRILTIIKTQRNGMTARQLFMALKDYDDLALLRINLSAMTKRGKLKTDGKHECPHCFSEHTVYRITEEGRMWLEERRDINKILP